MSTQRTQICAPVEHNCVRSLLIIQPTYFMGTCGNLCERIPHCKFAIVKLTFVFDEDEIMTTNMRLSSTNVFLCTLLKGTTYSSTSNYSLELIFLPLCFALVRHLLRRFDELLRN